MSYRKWVHTSSRIMAGLMALLVILIGTFIGRGYHLTYVLGVTAFLMISFLVLMTATHEPRKAKI